MDTVLFTNNDRSYLVAHDCSVGYTKKGTEGEPDELAVA